MKHVFLPSLLICFMLFACTSEKINQDSLQWNLPEGAKARLGKGSINEIRDIKIQLIV